MGGLLCGALGTEYTVERAGSCGPLPAPPPHLRVGNRRAALQGPGHGSDDSCRDTGSRSDTGRAEQV